MSKYRVYELAKEFKTESKVVLHLLERNGHAVKNHMSSVGDEEREMLRNIFSGDAARKKAEQKKAEQPPKTDKSTETTHRPEKKSGAVAARTAGRQPAAEHVGAGRIGSRGGHALRGGDRPAVRSGQLPDRKSVV